MSDAVSPDHYQFGDTQLISVTRRLTSNGGQSVQYIARATRTDGANKSSDDAGRLEDLLKARVFLDDEIARLRGDETAVSTSQTPRVWQDAFAIPSGVTVRDSSGDTAVIIEHGQTYYWTTDSPDSTITMEWGALREYAPFTEVFS